MPAGPRVMVVWCPDWPVVAALAAEELPGHLPAAVFARNLVVACNDAARTEGVRRRMRRRDAQARCPELTVLDANPDRDVRAFDAVLAAVEQLRPGVAPLRPGLVALRSPGRFYGGEPHAGAVVAERLVGLGFWDCRVGVADDLFTAEQAARRADPQETRVVASGGSAAFLRDLPVDVLDDVDTVSLLRRLGLRTLGDFAALPHRDVQGRFGRYGATVHRLARGDGAMPLATRVPPPELACHVEFEPPLESVETLCFSVRRTAERFVARLAERQLVCTRLLVEAECDGAVASSRHWIHPRCFGAEDVVHRVHWQLQGRTTPGPVGLVRFVPETVEPAAVHAEGLWGGGSDDRVERGVARVQGMLGYEAVVVPTLQGGRTPSARQALVPWGERATGLRPVELPWPGSIPLPAPTRLLADPFAAMVTGAEGQSVDVTSRGLVTCEPVRFLPYPDGGWQAVTAWAGPWPVEELWWEEPARRVARFQVVGVDGRAWLMTVADGAWWTEASYD